MDGFELTDHTAQNSPDEAKTAPYAWLEKQGY